MGDKVRVARAGVALLALVGMLYGPEVAAPLPSARALPQPVATDPAVTEPAPTEPPPTEPAPTEPAPTPSSAQPSEPSPAPSASAGPEPVVPEPDESGPGGAAPNSPAPAEPEQEDPEQVDAPPSLLPVAEPTAVGALTIDRLSGRDRYETAIAIAQSAYPDGAPAVVLASGADFPDALAAAPAAVAWGGPLLLTPTASLRDDVLREIRRLAPDVVEIVGGPSVVSDAVADALRAEGLRVDRHAGADRYATARAVVARAFPSASEAVIATGRGFPDALVAAAAAGSRGAPVLLVDGLARSADASTLATLRELGVSTVSIVGSSSVVSSGVAQSLRDAGLNVARFAGADRYGTALAVNQAFFDAAGRTFLASGADFPDALSGAAFAGSVGMPLTLSPGACVDGSISYDLRTRLATTRVTALGGVSVVSTAASSLQRCAGPSIDERALQAKLQSQLASLPGRYTISVRELDGQRRTVSIGGTEAREPASVIKLFAAYAILSRVDAGQLSLATPTRSGISIGNCLRVMIHISDNLCHADLLAVLGNNRINRILYDAGFTRTYYVGTDGSGVYRSAKRTTTADLTAMLARLEGGTLLSASSTALLTDLLEEQLWRSKIPSGVEQTVEFGNKTGQLWVTSGLVEGDAGIVHAPSGRYTIAVLGSDNSANWAIARLSRSVYEYFEGRSIEPASWSSTNLVAPRATTMYDRPGGSVIGTIPAGTLLKADSSNRVLYRVGYDGRWVWVHHTSVQTRY